MKGKVIAFGIWFGIILYIWIFASDFRTMTTAFILLFCGLCTLIFWLIRDSIRKIISKWKASPKLKFILIGSIAAIYVETVFWIIDQSLGVIGLAADSNLLLDLVFTMPWYILMLALLYKSETKVKYSWFALFLMGGLYDMFADGIVGNIIGVLTNPSLLILAIISFPMFTLTYSLMVLPPSYLVEDEIDKVRSENGMEKKSSKLKWTLIPLLGLLIIPVMVLIIGIIYALI